MEEAVSAGDLLAPNYAFVLESARRMAGGGRVLDYGCRRGNVVAEGLKSGLDVFGAEVFYGGGHGDRERAAELGLLQDRIFEIKNGCTPFADGFFSLVVHNQVFEHVPDLRGTLREIRRILAPGGAMLSIFPSREVVREGHCGVPLAHRFARSPRLRYAWLLSARMCGLGTFHGDKTPRRWARDFSQWLSDWCYYRPESEIRDTYLREGFSYEGYEVEYAAFRLGYTGRGWAIPMVNFMPSVTRWLIRRLAGMVIVSRK